MWTFGLGNILELHKIYVNAKPDKESVEIYKYMVDQWRKAGNN